MEILCRSFHLISGYLQIVSQSHPSFVVQVTKECTTAHPGVTTAQVCWVDYGRRTNWINCSCRSFQVSTQNILFLASPGTAWSKFTPAHWMLTIAKEKMLEPSNNVPEENHANSIFCPHYQCRNGQAHFPNFRPGHNQNKETPVFLNIVFNAPADETFHTLLTKCFVKTLHYTAKANVEFAGLPIHEKKTAGRGWWSCVIQ